MWHAGEIACKIHYNHAGFSKLIATVLLRFALFFPRPLIGEVPGISRVNVGTADGNGVEGPNRSGHRGSMVLAGGGRGGSGGGLRVQVGYCKKCREPKPARAHHCHVCDECIVNVRF